MYRKADTESTLWYKGNHFRAAFVRMVDTLRGYHFDKGDLISVRRNYYIGANHVLGVRFNRLWWWVWYPAGVELLNHHPWECHCDECRETS